MASQTLQHILIIGRSNFDEKTFKQMKRACSLPLSVIISMLGDLHIPHMLYIIKIKGLSASSLEYIFYIQLEKSNEEIIIMNIYSYYVLISIEISTYEFMGSISLWLVQHYSIS